MNEPLFEKYTPFTPKKLSRLEQEQLQTDKERWYRDVLTVLQMQDSVANRKLISEYFRLFRD